MKISIIDHYWGVELETSIESRKYNVRIERYRPISILRKDPSKEHNLKSNDTIPTWYMSPALYPVYSKRYSIRFIPPKPKPLWSISWENFPISDCFYFVNNAPQIKTMKRNSVKKYFEKVITKLNKLDAFL